MNKRNSTTEHVACAVRVDLWEEGRPNPDLSQAEGAQVGGATPAGHAVNIRTGEYLPGNVLLAVGSGGVR